MNQSDINFEPKEHVIRIAQKPKKCPNCGSTRIARYVYGLPDMSMKMQQQIDDGKIVLGGCCVNLDDPFCVCTECETEFYKQIR